MLNRVALHYHKHQRTQWSKPQPIPAHLTHHPILKQCGRLGNHSIEMPTIRGSCPRSKHLTISDSSVTTTNPGSSDGDLETAKASDSKAIANLNPDASKLIPLESTSEIQPVPEHATLGESSVMFKQVDSFIQFFKI